MRLDSACKRDDFCQNGAALTLNVAIELWVINIETARDILRKDLPFSDPAFFRVATEHLRRLEALLGEDCAYLLIFTVTMLSIVRNEKG